MASTTFHYNYYYWLKYFSPTSSEVSYAYTVSSTQINTSPYDSNCTNTTIASPIFSFSTSIVSEEENKKIKKLLKQMEIEMCKDGWKQPVSYYLEPKVISLNLKGVRLEGRGWGNKNK